MEKFDLDEAYASTADFEFFSKGEKKSVCYTM